jgi:hypothetical protein
MSSLAYQKVLDDRKRRVRGLWKRNGWFYARLSIVYSRVPADEKLTWERS